jgi:hypothetical protein
MKLMQSYLVIYVAGVCRLKMARCYFGSVTDEVTFVTDELHDCSGHDGSVSTMKITNKMHYID